MAKAVRIETSTGEERKRTLLNLQKSLHFLSLEIFREDLVLHDPAFGIIQFYLLQICQYLSNSHFSNVFVKLQKVSVRRSSVSVSFLIFTAFAQIQFEHLVVLSIN